ncbi:MAG: hypothetical protein M3Z02_03400 [Actinomycetota bacterium]|nr:hypothetical protein [Actinomycetota bacterium]
MTVALAAALQESKLHNLASGDRDSVGLFQQRPSQGWGTAVQIRTPRYATEAFYNRLVKVPDWQSLTVTDAAQAVQRSAAPRAYARQEPEARVLAQALTGEAPAALACRAPSGAGPTLTTSLAAGMRAELGGPFLGVDVPPVRAWAIAAWLIAHAQAYRIQSVSFGDQRWTVATGRWAAHGDVGPGVRINTG